MNAVATIPAILALCIAIAAAFTDWRRGQIPNWLTLPPLVIAPLGYGLALGAEPALRCVWAAALSGFVPYLLFRRGVMGGGDVKLLTALGATTGFDLVGGIEIQLIAGAAAMLVAFAALAWDGSLLRTVADAFLQVAKPILPARWRRAPSDALRTRVRLGGAILFATAVFVSPQLSLTWTAQ